MQITQGNKSLSNSFIQKVTEIILKLVLLAQYVRSILELQTFKKS